MEGLLQLVIMAMLVEAVWETMKMTWQDGKFSIDRAGALVVGVLASVTFNVDVFSLVGLAPSIQIVGVVLTGILISRGGNFIHDLLQKIGGDM